MRKCFTVLLAICCLVVSCGNFNNAFVYAQAPVPVPVPNDVILKVDPESLKLKTLRLGRIRVTETNGKQIRWVSTTENLEVIALDESGKAVLVQGLEAGNYYIIAYTALNSLPSDPIKIRVIVEDPVPPKPPVPPTPPVPPPPSDPFAFQLKAAWDKEDSIKKREALLPTINFYKWASKEAFNPDLKTMGDFNTSLRIESKKRKIENQLPKVAYVIGGYLQEKLPIDINANINPHRSTCETSMQTVANQLEKLQ